MTRGMLLLLMVGMAAACGSGSGRSPSGAAAPSTSTAATGTAAPTAPPGQGHPAPTGQRSEVIVDLAVRWEPESGLSQAAAAAQAVRIEAVQDELLRALGSHGTLVRRLTSTAQLALSVDAEGRALLSRSSQVAALHDDVARPPADGG